MLICLMFDLALTYPTSSNCVFFFLSVVLMLLLSFLFVFGSIELQQTAP